MAGRTINDFVKKLVRKLKDYSIEDSLTSGIDATTTTVPIVDGTRVSPGNILLIDSEVMRAESIATNNVTVTRAYRETTAATHSSGVRVYISRDWDKTDLESFINDGKEKLYPYFFDYNESTPVTINDTTDVYAKPTDLRKLVGVFIRDEASDLWKQTSRFKERGDKIQIGNYVDYQMKMEYLTGFSDVAGSDALWPSQADRFVIKGAMIEALEGWLPEFIMGTPKTEEASVANLVGVIRELERTLENDLRKARMPYPVIACGQL